MFFFDNYLLHLPNLIEIASCFLVVRVITDNKENDRVPFRFREKIKSETCSEIEGKATQRKGIEEIEDAIRIVEKLLEHGTRARCEKKKRDARVLMLIRLTSGLEL